MEFLKRHAALLALGAIIAVVFYSLGYDSGENRVSNTVVNIENVESVDSEVDNIDFSPFWRAWNIISEKYVPASTTAETITGEEKLYGAIAGLAASLGDPYTVFFPPVEAELFESDIRGNFEGVGMEILSESGAITVVAPLKNSPAFRAGMLAGDRIIKIEDKETSGMTTEDAVQLIRGSRGTAVTVTVFRQGTKEPFEVRLVRDIINIPVIDTRELPGEVFVIELYSFSESSPYLFRQALRKFILSENDKLIIDLRGNPGGYLEAAIDMASWFLPASRVVVREDFGSRQDERVYRSRGYDIFTDDFKFVILIDKGSASASEILAGALAEHGRATLVGETTFGKGSVQELIDITPETSLKVTVARWLTPNGISISEKGIEPDYKVSRTPDDFEAGRDPQLDKALEILRQ